MGMGYAGDQSLAGGAARNGQGSGGLSARFFLRDQMRKYLRKTCPVTRMVTLCETPKRAAF